MREKEILDKTELVYDRFDNRIWLVIPKAKQEDLVEVQESRELTEQEKLKYFAVFLKYFTKEASNLETTVKCDNKTYHISIEEND